jgi:hypothetical protein
MDSRSGKQKAAHIYSNPTRRTNSFENNVRPFGDKNPAFAATHRSARVPYTRR